MTLLLSLATYYFKLTMLRMRIGYLSMKQRASSICKYNFIATRIAKHFNTVLRLLFGQHPRRLNIRGIEQIHKFDMLKISTYAYYIRNHNIVGCKNYIPLEAGFAYLLIHPYASFVPKNVRLKIVFPHRILLH